MLCRVIRGSSNGGMDSLYLPYAAVNNTEFLDIKLLRVGSIITFVVPKFDLEEAHGTCNWPNFITEDGILGTIEYHKHNVHPSQPIWVEELTEKNC